MKFSVLKMNTCIDLTGIQTDAKTALENKYLLGTARTLTNSFLINAHY